MNIIFIADLLMLVSLRKDHVYLLKNSEGLQGVVYIENKGNKKPLPERINWQGQKLNR